MVVHAPLMIGTEMMSRDPEISVSEGNLSSCDPAGDNSSKSSGLPDMLSPGFSHLGKSDLGLGLDSHGSAPAEEKSSASFLS